MKYANEIKLVKRAIDEGKKVYMTPNKNYQVIKDQVGQYLIRCNANDSYTGLHGRENTKYENNINYLCQDNGNPYPINILSKNGDIQVIKL